MASLAWTRSVVVLLVAGVPLGVAARAGAVGSRLERLESGERVDLVLRSGERVEGTYTGSVRPAADASGASTITDHEDWRPPPPGAYALVKEHGLGAVPLRDVVDARVRRDRIHDGFQFRGTLGAGALELHTQLASGRLIANGISRGYELFAGFTPARGLTAGGFFTFSGANLKDARDEEAVAFGLALVAAGPYVDYYPDPREGFHVLATLGPAAAMSQTLSPYGSGPTLGVGVGYDAWLAREWSAGFLLRVSRAWLEGNAIHDGTVDSATLSLSAVYQ